MQDEPTTSANHLRVLADIIRFRAGFCDPTVRQSELARAAEMEAKAQTMEHAK